VDNAKKSMEGSIALFLNIITNVQENKLDSIYLYMLVTIGLAIGYLLVRPAVKWFITNRVFDLLSYIMVSLILCIMLSASYFMLGLSPELFRLFLKVILQLLAYFGAGLVIWNLIRVLFIKHS
jgi:hypothetical protein